jgi:hypothetical protein
MPVQVWATWFPRDGKPRSFIQGFGLHELRLSWDGGVPFQFDVDRNCIKEDSCRGELKVDAHHLRWNLKYRSSFASTLSNKGWIGFSRTPHSDAVFTGQITLDDQVFEGNPLGFGLQGHNCGYRHRTFWNWTHAYFPRNDAAPTTLEALEYDLPFGMTFRRAILWHGGRRYGCKLMKLSEERNQPLWKFRGISREGLQVEATVDGGGVECHRLPYLKTDCSGTFEVVNNSLAKAELRVTVKGRTERLETRLGAVLEMAGTRRR